MQLSVPVSRPSRATLLLVSLFLASAGCDGGSQGERMEPAPAAEPQEAPPVTAVPVLAFEQPVQALGSIYDAAEQVVRFAFTNDGDAELVIGEIKVTCGCTTTQLERKRYAPGEGSSIDVAYKPAGSGGMRRTVSVHSNDPARPVFDLHMDANIRPFLQFDPPQVLLGDLDRGVEHRAAVRFRCGDPSALVLEITSLHPQLAVHTLGEDEQGWQRLELVLGTAIPWGSFVGRVAVRVKGVAAEGAEPIEHTGRLLVQAMMFDQVRVDPVFLSVGLAQPAAPFRAQTVVIHRRGEPFGLAELRLENPVPDSMTVRAEPLTGPRSGYTLILEDDSRAHTGTIGGALVVETDLPGEPPLRVTIVGRVGEVPVQRKDTAHSH